MIGKLDEQATIRREVYPCNALRRGICHDGMSGEIWFSLENVSGALVSVRELDPLPI